MYSGIFWAISLFPVVLSVLDGRPSWTWTLVIEIECLANWLFRSKGFQLLLLDNVESPQLVNTTESLHCSWSLYGRDAGRPRGQLLRTVVLHRPGWQLLRDVSRCILVYYMLGIACCYGSCASSPIFCYCSSSSTLRIQGTPIMSTTISV